MSRPPLAFRETKSVMITFTVFTPHCVIFACLATVTATRTQGVTYTFHVATAAYAGLRSGGLHPTKKMNDLSQYIVSCSGHT